MEKVLNLYEKPLDAHHPVLVLDEKAVQLHGEVRRDFTGLLPGRVPKQDYEYVRNGTANIFCVVEPKAGRHLDKVTPNRTAVEFAKMLRDISHAYPEAEKIHLVMDNLNTHVEKSLVTAFGQREGRRLWRRIHPHYTPPHGSWLNQAEIEVCLVSKECLGKSRCPNIDELKARVSAWRKDANRRRRKIHWRFTAKRARSTFQYSNTHRRKAPDESRTSLDSA